MDFFLGESDDEEEEDDVEVEFEEEGQAKGVGKDRGLGGVLDEELKDITGKNIANPSPFFKKLREYEPTLFFD